MFDDVLDEDCQLIAHALDVDLAKSSDRKLLWFGPA
jgi:hypothetical protein